jgi:hypothetical protein
MSEINILDTNLFQCRRSNLYLNVWGWSIALVSKFWRHGECWPADVFIFTRAGTKIWYCGVLSSLLCAVDPCRTQFYTARFWLNIVTTVHNTEEKFAYTSNRLTVSGVSYNWFIDGQALGAIYYCWAWWPFTAAVSYIVVCVFVIWCVFLRSLLLSPAYKKVVVKVGC